MAEVTVVFCTFKRYDCLRNAVESLTNSSDYDSSSCRVLVVDNTPPSERSKPNLPEAASLLTCDHPGLSHARNAGISASDTELVAFVDDDALVQDGWLSSLLNAHRNEPDALIFGGKTEPHAADGFFPVWWSDWLATHLSCIDWGDRTRPLEPGEWLVGANIAFRRTVFEQYGFFNTELGRRGSAGLLSNEETALIRSVGLTATFYCPGMHVKHVIPPERLTREWFRKRVAWQAISDSLSGETYLEREQAWANLWDYIISVPAEVRSTRSLFYAADEPDSFAKQLKGLYAHASLLCEGFAAPNTGVEKGLVS